ncbi:hypothetical protein NUW58_g6629 [Xylaria curta]|uniref:Uncharacterized protein n=1 Tax=Xylaria curta TaxID=42375 RepID=A0ACC1NQW4_9PEZI|nr:hypothetical protein NUW58_g6629 [Xylaria curta]
MPNVITLAVVAGFFAILVQFGAFRSVVTKERLKRVPELRFETEDTEARHARDSRPLLRHGYDKCLRNGVPFQFPSNTVHDSSFYPGPGMPGPLLRYYCYEDDPYGAAHALRGKARGGR